MKKHLNGVEFYLFKTNVSQPCDISGISPYLNGIVEYGKWSFDLEDDDKVLCLHCTPELKPKVEHLMRVRGFIVEELHYLENEG